MTYILGLHLGHDASASIVGDVGLLVSVVQERLTRVRHDFGLDIETIDTVLKSAGVSLDDIDRVAITCTQLMPAVIRSPGEFSFRELPRLTTTVTLPQSQKQVDSESRIEASSDDLLRLQGRDWVAPEDEKRLILDSWRSEDPPTYGLETLHSLLVGQRRIPYSRLREWDMHLINDPLTGREEWKVPISLAEVKQRVARNLRTRAGIPMPDHSCPIEVTIRGKIIQGNFWAHHATHAASNLSLDHRPRLVITHDGGLGTQSGGIWDWNGQDLTFLSPHYFELGQLYDYVASNLGLGTIGGAGKLMGLASYGSGRLWQSTQLPVGNAVDLSSALAKRFGPLPDTGIDLYRAFWRLAQMEAKTESISLAGLGSPYSVTNAGPIEIVNFTQRYVQECFSDLAIFCSTLGNYEVLGISGGFALNCPTNTAVSNAVGDGIQVVIEPHCEDGGCSIGAATLSYLGVAGQLPSSTRLDHTNGAFVGPSPLVISSVFLRVAAEKVGGRLIEVEEPASLIAAALLEDRVVAVVSGRSEVGPRALGHRSILANATHGANWERVNDIKGREKWRPFAPVVLEEDLYTYFEQGPKSSPHMLFNYVVRPSARESLPAICHVDGTSRVQTVAVGDEPLWSILRALKGLGQLPVILNTSFNGPGDPIVETAQEAIDMWSNTAIEVLLVEKFLLVKPGVDF
jgi:carbamoyltransferase